MKPRRRPSSSILEGVPIAGVVGINGAGKTLLAAQQAICELAAGREVYSTVPITSRFGDSKPIRSLRELLELADCHVLLDEVAVVFSSRSTNSLPPEVDTFLQVMRHRKITMTWTAPGWMRPDNRLREVTQAVVNVMPLARRRERGNPWPRPRLVASALLDCSAGKVDAIPDKVMRRRFYIPTRLDSFGSYDTHADTPLLGHRLESGTCPDCGGSRTRPKHSEARHTELGIPWYGDDDDPRRGIPAPAPATPTFELTEEPPA